MQLEKSPQLIPGGSSGPPMVLQSCPESRQCVRPLYPHINQSEAVDYSQGRDMGLGEVVLFNEGYFSKKIQSKWWTANIPGSWGKSDYVLMRDLNMA